MWRQMCCYTLRNTSSTETTFRWFHQTKDNPSALLPKTTTDGVTLQNQTSQALELLQGKVYQNLGDSSSACSSLPVKRTRKRFPGMQPCRSGSNTVKNISDVIKASAQS